MNAESRPASRRPLSGPLLGARAWIPGAGLLVAAGVLLAAGAVLLTVNQARLAESMRWVEHTEHVLIQVTDLNLALVDVESATRALSLTENESYRADFTQARDSVQAHLASLIGLVTDNPVQAQRLEEIRPMIQARIARFEALLAAAPEQRVALMARPAVEESQALRRQLRGRLDEFRAREISLLNARNTQATRAASLFSVLALLTGAAGMGFGGVGLYLLQRERARARIRELQSELHHLSRLTTIGQTASMLTHEIKQPLTAAVSYLDAATRMEQSATTAPAKVGDLLQKAAAQVRRASEIVGRLRGFVEKRETQRGIEPVRALIEDAVMMLGPLRGGVRLELRVPQDLPPLDVDRVLVQQVLVNLMRNAIEAMAESPRREITISAHPEGPWVEISVADTGPGLPVEVRNQLFKPFVSTKPEGMGVGLSICRTIVIEHGGKVWAGNEPAGGAVFHFTLPVAASHYVA